MGLNTNVFQEPRGVMRIIQFIFAICAFATTVDYDNVVSLRYCEANNVSTTFRVEYPFKLDGVTTKLPPCEPSKPDLDFRIPADFSSDAQFFVATGVLSMLYAVGISVVYVMFDAAYQSNALIPMADFMLTVLLAVFWLSGSAAWANGLEGLKSMISPEVIETLTDCRAIHCRASVGSFSGLNVSVILGFLNFFLWASDLWFLYKETQWFKNASPTTPAGAASPGFK